MSPGEAANTQHSPTVAPLLNNPQRAPAVLLDGPPELGAARGESHSPRPFAPRSRRAHSSGHTGPVKMFPSSRNARFQALRSFPEKEHPSGDISPWGSAAGSPQVWRTWRHRDPVWGTGRGTSRSAGGLFGVTLGPAL